MNGNVSVIAVTVVAGINMRETAGTRNATERGAIARGKETVTVKAGTATDAETRRTVTGRIERVAVFAAALWRRLGGLRISRGSEGRKR